ncbi:MAG: hypothetical protein BWZ10_01765 [candidate division BRC1 bacterium ADurb.BinA364]|nr:MAG: hypothetical protein BWZ10_01765 [candidate division BRC1 bacterium ADurb.BinA364]
MAGGVVENGVEQPQPLLFLVARPVEGFDAHAGKERQAEGVHFARRRQPHQKLERLAHVRFVFERIETEHVIDQINAQIGRLAAHANGFLQIVFAIENLAHHIRRAGLEADVDVGQPGFPGPFQHLLHSGCRIGVAAEGQADALGIALAELPDPGRIEQKDIVEQAHRVEVQPLAHAFHFGEDMIVAAPPHVFLLAVDHSHFGMRAIAAAVGAAALGGDVVGVAEKIAVVLDADFDHRVVFEQMLVVAERGEGQGVEVLEQRALGIARDPSAVVEPQVLDIGAPRIGAKLDHRVLAFADAHRVGVFERLLGIEPDVDSAPDDFHLGQPATQALRKVGAQRGEDAEQRKGHGLEAVLLDPIDKQLAFALGDDGGEGKIVVAFGLGDIQEAVILLELRAERLLGARNEFGALALEMQVVDVVAFGQQRRGDIARAGAGLIVQRDKRDFHETRLAGGGPQENHCPPVNSRRKARMSST